MKASDASAATKAACARDALAGASRRRRDRRQVVPIVRRDHSCPLRADRLRGTRTMRAACKLAGFHETPAAFEIERSKARLRAKVDLRDADCEARRDRAIQQRRGTRRSSCARCSSTQSAAAEGRRSAWPFVEVAGDERNPDRTKKRGRIVAGDKGSRQSRTARPGHVFGDAAARNRQSMTTRAA